MAFTAGLQACIGRDGYCPCAFFIADGPPTFSHPSDPSTPYRRPSPPMAGNPRPFLLGVLKTGVHGGKSATPIPPQCPVATHTRGGMSRHRCSQAQGLLVLTPFPASHLELCMGKDIRLEASDMHRPWPCPIFLLRLQGMRMGRSGCGGRCHWSAGRGLQHPPCSSMKKPIPVAAICAAICTFQAQKVWLPTDVPMS